MTSESIRDQQSKLKDQYRDHPESALHVMAATGEVTQPSYTIRLPTHIGDVVAGLHTAAGGDGSHACSGDMLLEALIGCAGVTLAAVATAMRITLNNAEISASGDLDFRGTMGVDPVASVGFENLRLHFNLDTDAPQESVEKLISLTEKYCVIYQTLSKQNTITTSAGPQ
ncbi:MAG: OsmC family protein [Pirellulaceae bacterium]|nr:OsmC family protein [Pirellulaceae bacterium]